MINFYRLVKSKIKLFYKSGKDVNDPIKPNLTFQLEKSNKTQIEEDKKLELMKIRLSYSQDILNKRYDLYNWIDSKARISLTINGVFLGLFYWSITNYSYDLVSKLLMFSGILTLTLSTLILLSVAIPAMKSPVWKTKSNSLIVQQPRTVIGVNEFGSIEKYLDTITSLTIGDMIKFNVDQIWKMNKIVLTSSKRIATATRLTIIAMTMLIVSFSFLIATEHFG